MNVQEILDFLLEKLAKSDINFSSELIVVLDNKQYKIDKMMNLKEDEVIIKII